MCATEYFRFHPALAQARASTHSPCGRRHGRTATEGSTLAASTARGGCWPATGATDRRGLRERYPVFDLDLQEVSTLDAPYPTNIPWPTLVPVGDSWLLVGFDGTPSTAGR